MDVISIVSIRIPIPVPIFALTMSQANVRHSVTYRVQVAAGNEAGMGPAAEVMFWKNDMGKPGWVGQVISIHGPGSGLETRLGDSGLCDEQTSFSRIKGEITHQIIQ